MDSKLLVVNTITLLFRESQQTGHTNNSSELALKVVEEIKAPEITMGREVRDRHTEVMMGLRDTLHDMARNPYNHQYEATNLLQRLKMNVGDDDTTYEALQDGIMPEYSESALKRTCLNLNRQVTKYFRDKDVEAIIAKAFNKIKYQKTKIPNVSAFVAETMAQLANYTGDIEENDPAIVGEVDFGSLEQVSGVFQTVQDDDSGDWIMQSGLQGWNRMMDGGVRRGETIVNAALPHNFKTGSSLMLFRQLACYNVPKLRDPTKKPLLLRISFEDDLKENFSFIYSQIVHNDEGRAADMSIDKDELSSYVMERLTRNGFHIKMMRVNPSLWTYLDIQNKILRLESEGYEVCACFLDYLGMVPTTGCITTTMGSDMRDMYRRLRNFCAPRGISLITPHQLSQDAKKLVREGHSDLVKLLVGKGYYDTCGRLDQEVDVEIFQHIETVNGRPYLTWQRGKHRKSRQTPINDRYFCLPLHDIGNILDDVGKADTTLKKPGGAPIGQARATPVWDFDFETAAGVQ